MYIALYKSAWSWHIAIESQVKTIKYNGGKHMTLKDILGASISREEALERIRSSERAYEEFCDFSERDRERILEFIEGKRGLPISYDGIYKYIFDPEVHPERLEDFLSEILGDKVVIEKVLSKEGNKLAEEGSLVVMDIIVRLSDGSIVDVEMQKYGYLFTGERSSCYLSDMVMRQYNRIKKKKKKDFQFKHMKPVYLIILMEKSSKEFKQVSPQYIHRLQQTFDSGVKLNLLSNLTYISLDTFKDVSQNISNKLEAWLTFLSSDRPEDMLRLVEKYPEFVECYHDIAEFRINPEELITMFSEALIQMDKNTVKYMIEEQQKELEAQEKELKAQQRELKEQEAVLEAQEEEIKAQKKEIRAQEKELEANQKELEANQKELEANQKELRSLKEENDKQAARIAELEAQLKQVR